MGGEGSSPLDPAGRDGVTMQPFWKCSCLQGFMNLFHGQHQCNTQHGLFEFVPQVAIVHFHFSYLFAGQEKLIALAHMRK